MRKFGEKFINGKLLNLDKESIENLELCAQDILSQEDMLRDDLDEIINNMIQ